MKLRSRPEVKPVETIDGHVTDFVVQFEHGANQLPCRNLVVTMTIPIGDMDDDFLREMISNMRYGIKVVKLTNPREAQ